MSDDLRLTDEEMAALEAHLRTRPWFADQRDPELNEERRELEALRVYNLELRKTESGVPSEKAPTIDEGEWLVPMPKKEIARRLNISMKQVPVILGPYGFKQHGNRQLWTARLDMMPANYQKMLG